MKSQKEIENLWLECRQKKKALIEERDAMYKTETPTEKIDHISHKIEIEEDKMNLLAFILDYK